MTTLPWLHINILASSRRIGGVLCLVGVDVSDERQSNRWNRVGANSECVWSDGQLGVQCEYDACTPGTMCGPMHVHDSWSPSLYVSVFVSICLCLCMSLCLCLDMSLFQMAEIEYCHSIPSGGDLAPSLGGGRKIFSRAKISELRFFRKKFPFSPRKFLMTFSSHRPGF